MGLTPAERSIEVVLIAIAAPDASSYSEHAGFVADLASQQDGVIHTLLPLVVVALDGLSPASSDHRLRFVAAVQSRLPGEVAILHGSVSAHIGPFGSPQRMDLGLWWPGLLDALQQLATVPLGDAHEIHPHTPNV